MCRLLALTPSLPLDVKRDVFDRAMLLQMAEAQVHGWGITDGQNVWKDRGRYAWSVGWGVEANPETVWVGHVRRASAGTGLNVREAHPFRFPGFIGCHNGFLEPAAVSGERVPDETDPESDSFRGLTRLSDFMDEGFPADGKQIGRWASSLYEGSTFSVMLLPTSGAGRGGRSLQVFKDNRTKLHFSEVGDGYLLMTSLDSLEDMRAYLIGRHGLRPGPARRVPPYHLYTIDFGSRAYREQRLGFVLQARRKTWRWW